MNKRKVLLDRYMRSLKVVKMASKILEKNCVLMIR